MRTKNPVIALLAPFNPATFDLLCAVQELQKKNFDVLVCPYVKQSEAKPSENDLASMVALAYAEIFQKCKATRVTLASRVLRLNNMQNHLLTELSISMLDMNEDHKRTFAFFADDVELFVKSFTPLVRQLGESIELILIGRIGYDRQQDTHGTQQFFKMTCDVSFLSDVLSQTTQRDIRNQLAKVGYNCDEWNQIPQAVRNYIWTWCLYMEPSSEPDVAVQADKPRQLATA